MTYCYCLTRRLADLLAYLVAYCLLVHLEGIGDTMSDVGDEGIGDTEAPMGESKSR